MEVDDNADLDAAAASISAGDLMQASQSTMATVAGARGDQQAASSQKQDDASVGKDDIPLNEDSSSNVLFHPPAAHEEHSEDDSQDSNVQLTAKAKVAQNSSIDASGRKDELDLEEDMPEENV